MSSSKGKLWYLDLDFEKHHIYVYKDNKRLCQEGGLASGKEYGQVCQLTSYHQPNTETTFLKVANSYNDPPSTHTAYMNDIVLLLLY